MLTTKKIIPASLLVIICLASVHCSGPKSALPPKLQEGTEITYDQNGNMTPDYLSLTLKNDSLFYMEQKVDGQTKIEWQIPVEKADMEMVYDLFVSNKIDRIKNEPNPVTVYDAGSEELSLRMNGGKYYAVTYGANTPLSRNDQKEFTAVADGIKKLVGKYKALR